MHQPALGRHVYDSTDRISLVSSFMASLLIGRYACIEETNNTGMNLMDIATCDPVQRTSLRFTIAPNLQDKIGKLVPVHAAAGQRALRPHPQPESGEVEPPVAEVAPWGAAVGNEQRRTGKGYDGNFIRWK
ncbi:hypothetical protein GUJ93_ZPchr0006g43701 [Zizania palustris]|uniref:Uncharacterized protein n=1 Tax=Zizania palustris TaxID=103762 RepID=A0A8J5SU62_ZIZPA|nr:hypothetical protein GUJ93_ZPchr0006g43701 [Zizania palustris]